MRFRTSAGRWAMKGSARTTAVGDAQAARSGLGHANAPSRRAASSASSVSSSSRARATIGSSADVRRPTLAHAGDHVIGVVAPRADDIPDDRAGEDPRELRRRVRQHQRSGWPAARLRRLRPGSGSCPRRAAAPPRRRLRARRDASSSSSNRHQSSSLLAQPARHLRGADHVGLPLAVSLVERRDPGQPLGALHARFRARGTGDGAGLLEHEPLHRRVRSSATGSTLGLAGRCSGEHAIGEPQADLPQGAGADRLGRQRRCDLGRRDGLRRAAAARERPCARPHP